MVDELSHIRIIFDCQQFSSYAYIYNVNVFFVDVVLIVKRIIFIFRRIKKKRRIVVEYTHTHTQ